MNDSLDLLRQEISELERKIAIRKNVLRTLQEADGRPVTAVAPTAESLEYVNLCQADAIERALLKSERPLSPNELLDELERGGATLNKKRGRNNCRIAIEINIKSGRLLLEGVKFDPKDMERIQELVGANRGKIRLTPKAPKPPKMKRRFWKKPG